MVNEKHPHILMTTVMRYYWQNIWQRVIPGSLSDFDVLLSPYCGSVIQVPATNTLNINNNNQDNIYGAVIRAKLQQVTIQFIC